MIPLGPMPTRAHFFAHGMSDYSSPDFIHLDPPLGNTRFSPRQVTEYFSFAPLNLENINVAGFANKESRACEIVERISVRQWRWSPQQESPHKAGPDRYAAQSLVAIAGSFSPRAQIPLSVIVDGFTDIIVELPPGEPGESVVVHFIGSRRGRERREEIILRTLSPEEYVGAVRSRVVSAFSNAFRAMDEATALSDGQRVEVFRGMSDAFRPYCPELSDAFEVVQHVARPNGSPERPERPEPTPVPRERYEGEFDELSGDFGPITGEPIDE